QEPGRRADQPGCRDSVCRGCDRRGGRGPLAARPRVAGRRAAHPAPVLRLRPVRGGPVRLPTDTGRPTRGPRRGARRAGPATHRGLTRRRDVETGLWKPATRRWAVDAIRFEHEAGDSFYRAVKQRVDDYFRRTGKSRLADRSILVKAL